MPYGVLFRSAAISVFALATLAAETRYRPVPVVVDYDRGSNVSVGQLKRKIDKKAKKEFMKACAAEDKKDLLTAIQHLRASIQLAPDFVEAYNNLGVALISQGRYEEGLTVLQKAIDLDPYMAAPQVNMASGLAVSNRGADAERAVRRALEIDNRSPQAHIILAIALMMQNKAPEETLVHLRKASDRFPEAHNLAARLLRESGQTQKADIELDEYRKATTVAGE